MTHICVENLTKIYTVEKNKVVALDKVNIKVEQGDFIILFGPSGSGKTTLLMLLGALIKPTEGTIYYDKIDITKFSEDQAATWRHNNVGFIFQKINLVDFLNILDNVMLPMYTSNKPPEEIEKKALELINKVSLKKRIKHKPAQLSVGEQQRVAIARALINNPKIVLADEPTAHLDTKNGKKIIELMKSLHSEYNTTFVISTHDPEMTKIADRVIQLRDGKIINA